MIGKHKQVRVVFEQGSMKKVRTDKGSVMKEAATFACWSAAERSIPADQ